MRLSHAIGAPLLSPEFSPPHRLYTLFHARGAHINRLAPRRERRDTPAIRRVDTKMMPPCLNIEEAAWPRPAASFWPRRRRVRLIGRLATDAAVRDTEAMCRQTVGGYDYRLYLCFIAAFCSPRCHMKPLSFRVAAGAQYSAAASPAAPPARVVVAP